MGVVVRLCYRCTRSVNCNCYRQMPYLNIPLQHGENVETMAARVQSKSRARPRWRVPERSHCRPKAENFN